MDATSRSHVGLVQCCRLGEYSRLPGFGEGSGAYREPKLSLTSCGVMTSAPEPRGRGRLWRLARALAFRWRSDESRGQPIEADRCPD